MDEDDVGDVGEKSAKKNPMEPWNQNVRKLRKRLGAIKWVRKLGHLLETQNDWDEEIPPWVHAVWEIIMSMDKSSKQYVKDKARAGREKQKRREKKDRKKAKPSARKAAGKKTQDSSNSSSSDSETTSSEDNSNSSTTSADSTPRRRTGGRRVGAVSSRAPEFQIINGHFKS